MEAELSRGRVDRGKSDELQSVDGSRIELAQASPVQIA
jgi:hypothetical protein